MSEAECPSITDPINLQGEEGKEKGSNGLNNRVLEKKMGGKINNKEKNRLARNRI